MSDPFCDHKRHREGLQRFLTELRKLLASIKTVEIHCRKAKQNDNDYEHRLHVKAHMEDILAALQIENASVYVQDNRQPVSALHDREIAVVVVGADGTSSMHRYFLTGGIDHLMDPRSATRVFHYHAET